MNTGATGNAKPFLQELAEQVRSEKAPLEQRTFVFPNRRAGLFFQHYLAQGLTRPQWSPRMLSIEEFFKAHSALREPDRLTLIHTLYRVYLRTVKQAETFDKFYFWGDMLLRDFDEVDKYHIDAGLLFKDLSKMKELDEAFDFLTPEQKEFLKNFWQHFQDQPPASKGEFLRLWRKLPQVYTGYVRALEETGSGYEGLIHRKVAAGLQNNPPPPADAEQVIFAGFNALTRAEETLVCAYVSQGARMFWDYDAYYVNDSRQEAGVFARGYRHHPVLGKTFPAELPENLRAGKSIWLTGVSQRIGQAKLAGVQAQEVLSRIPPAEHETELSKTVIVLPDESLLLPVLHSLPQELTAVNVTMGFPLRATPLFALLDRLLDLQIRRRNEQLPHREVTAILEHAYVMMLAGDESTTWIEGMVRKNRVRVPAGELQAVHPVFQLLFQPTEPGGAVAYLLEVVQYLGASFTDRQSFDREYAFHFYQHLARLQLIFGKDDPHPDWRGFQKLFRQVIQSQKIPFTGEPLRGLQIMGVMETRNLDFENVIILSMNEGSFPAAPRQGSYIPHALRKAYGLPAHDHQDAMYAYLFYRVLQRAGRVDLLYNTEPDLTGTGEMSRYVQQLLLESGLPVARRVLHNTIHVSRPRSIEIEKTPEVCRQMNKYVAGQGDRYLSPSSINDFIECGLRFYLRHVAELREPETLEDEISARTFGNILHEVVRWLYHDSLGRTLEAEDIAGLRQRIPALTDRAFRQHFSLDENQEVSYEGQRVVVKEIVQQFAHRILDVDAAHAPLEIVQLEEKFEFEVRLADGRAIRAGGKIDRVDYTGRVLRVIDYKTGADKMEFEHLESLFARDSKRNKAAFQTMLYAYAFHAARGGAQPLKPGLYNRTSLFDEHFRFGLVMNRQVLDDVRPLLDPFEVMLRQTVHDLYDPLQPFAQTTHVGHCEFCTYKVLCRR